MCVNGTHIDHPALCGQNWVVDGSPQENLTTSNATCQLTDNYVCVQGSSRLYYIAIYYPFHSYLLT